MIHRFYALAEACAQTLGRDPDNPRQFAQSDGDALMIDLSLARGCSTATRFLDDSALVVENGEIARDHASRGAPARRRRGRSRRRRARAGLCRLAGQRRRRRSIQRDADAGAIDAHRAGASRVRHDLAAADDHHRCAVEARGGARGGARSAGGVSRARSASMSRARSSICAARARIPPNGSAP